MNIVVENNKIVVEGNKEDFQPLVEAKLISQELLMGTGTFYVRGVTMRITLDNIIEGITSHDFVRQYREKFPEGVSRTYGKSFRGVLGKVKDNLKRFKKTYKYSDEQILEATENMVSRMIKLGKKDFIPQAQYFIFHKERGSELAEECENLLHGERESTGSKWK